MCACVCVCVCVFACVRACVRACVCVSMASIRACMHVYQFVCKSAYALVHTGGHFTTTNLVYTVHYVLGR